MITFNELIRVLGLIVIVVVLYFVFMYFAEKDYWKKREDKKLNKWINRASKQ